MASLNLTAAKSDRTRQLYDNGIRLVTGCIPFIRGEMNHDTWDRLRALVDTDLCIGKQTGDDCSGSFAPGTLAAVVMVNSRKRPEEWLFPKGGWESGEDAWEGAARETWEEAGVRLASGSMQGARGVPLRKLAEGPCCSLEKKRKADSDSVALQPKTSLAVFALEITAEAVESMIFADWPERHQRGRRLIPLEEAITLIVEQTRRKDRDVMLAAVRKLQTLLLAEAEEQPRVEVPALPSKVA